MLSYCQGWESRACLYPTAKWPFTCGQTLSLVTESQNISLLAHNTEKKWIKKMGRAEVLRYTGHIVFWAATSNGSHAPPWWRHHYDLSPSSPLPRNWSGRWALAKIINGAPSDASLSSFWRGHCVAKGMAMKARRWRKGTSTALHKNVSCFVKEAALQIMGSFSSSLLLNNCSQNVCVCVCVPTAIGWT